MNRHKRFRKAPLSPITLRGDLKMMGSLYRRATGYRMRLSVETLEDRRLLHHDVISASPLNGQENVSTSN